MTELNQLTDRLSSLGLSEGFTPFPSSNPEQNPADIYRSYISEELSRVSGAPRDVCYQGLERPVGSLEGGDLRVPIPRLRIKGRKPNEMAAEFAEKFNKGPLLSKVNAEGIFIQFHFDNLISNQLILSQILEKKSAYGDSTVGNGKKVVLEFSSPNIAKPFHAGHLRSTIIGGFLSNLYEKLGWEVMRLNYLGDWGKQFGILAVGFKRFGSEEKLLADPINHLFEVYVKVNQEITSEKEATEGQGEGGKGISATDEEARSYFKRMEDGDKEALSIWERFRDLSIEKYKETYGRLNIHYDQYLGESLVKADDMKAATVKLQEMGLLTEDRGALLVDLKKYSKKLEKVLVQKSDGTSLYITRDIAGAVERWEKYKFDKMIYVIASQQDLHCAQFFKILDLMGYEFADRLEHISYGLVLGMSTRKGTVVFLDDILNETKDKMHEVMRKNEEKYNQVENPDEIADKVGISAVMIQDMASKRVNNYQFDWSRMLSFEGDTGPYLQYAHSRLRSIERKAAEEYGIDTESLSDADFKLLTEPVAGELSRTLGQFPDVLLAALRASEASTIITYLFKMSHLISSCYDVLWVSKQDKEVAKARLALYSSARIVLNTGMRVLGLTPVDRM